MKYRILALLVAVVLILPTGAVFAEAAVDAMSSASVADYYGDSALIGDELMNAVNSFAGFYIVSTTNPDGTPCSAYFIYSMRKHEDQYYLQMGLAENQSRINLEANGLGVAVYAATPSSEEGAKPYAVSGARIYFQNIEDQAVLDALRADAKESTMFFEITEIKSLG